MCPSASSLPNSCSSSSTPSRIILFGAACGAVSAQHMCCNYLTSMASSGHHQTGDSGLMCHTHSSVSWGSLVSNEAAGSLPSRPRYTRFSLQETAQHSTAHTVSRPTPAAAWGAAVNTWLVLVPRPDPRRLHLRPATSSSIAPPSCCRHSSPDHIAVAITRHMVVRAVTCYSHLALRSNL